MNQLLIIIFFQAYISSLVGVGDNYYSNIASLLSFTSGLYKNDSYSDVLEINNTEIFGVHVRIYKPVNKTNESAGTKGNNGTLLPGVIYFHGGGWTIGSLGKLYHCDRQDSFLSTGKCISQIVPKLCQKGFTSTIPYWLYLSTPAPSDVMMA